jgi:hypothetical protein
MFNDRDLGILGAGALLSVFCLILPLPFAGKVVLGTATLVGFILLALLRLGPDRIPLEEWLRRRVRFRLLARRYTYQEPGHMKKPPRRAGRDRSQREASKRERPGMRRIPDTVPLSEVSFRPFALALEEVGVYPLATVLLATIGIYFIAWLAQGGAAEIGSLIGGLLP